MASRDSFRVRAYKVGVGDCFLISWSQESKVFNMLIDCGTHKNCASKKNLKSVIHDINAATVPGGLDVLVLSHTDMDHMVGLCEPSLPKLEPAPREIWVPVNCHPSYKSTAKYTAMGELTRCFDSFATIGNTVAKFVDDSFWRGSKDQCLQRILAHYSSAEIRYVHSGQNPVSLSSPRGSCLIEVLNPPPPTALLLRVLLDMIPKEVLHDAGLSRAEIDSIKKRPREYPEWYEGELLPGVAKRLKEDLDNRPRSDTLPVPTKKELGAICKTGKTLAHGGKVLKKDAKGLCDYSSKLYRMGLLTAEGVLAAILPVKDEANQDSVVLNITWARRSLLFTGDLVDWGLIRHRLKPVALLKVPHHGGNGAYLEDKHALKCLIPTDPVRASPLAIIPTCAKLIGVNPKPCCYNKKSPNPKVAAGVLTSIGFSTIETSSSMTNPALYTDVYILPYPLPALYAIHYTNHVHVYSDEYGFSEHHPGSDSCGA